jgi:hypothetical protein
LSASRSGVREIDSRSHSAISSTKLCHILQQNN